MNWILRQLRRVEIHIRPLESKHNVCLCGKEWHYKDAAFCSACGRKLKGAPAKGPL